MAVRDRISLAVARVTRRPARASHPSHPAPLWVRGLTAGGRPVVLAVALLMCAPGEYHLARDAGWDKPFALGMPIVLSAYAGIAAAVASTRRPGDRGRWSAIIGACLALSLAMAAQVVSHWVTTGHLDADQPWLIATVSAVPPAVVGHLLHLAASPPAMTTPTPLPKREPGVALAELADETPEPDEPEGEQPERDREPDPSHRLLTTRQVADRYGVEQSTVGTWKQRGKITPAVTDPALGNLYDPEQLPELT